MTKHAHPPEPWTYKGEEPYADNGDRSLYGVIRDRDGDCVAIVADPPDEKYDDRGKVEVAATDRIVACVNACAGINPEAVPDMLREMQSIHAMVTYIIDGGLSPRAQADFLAGIREGSRATIAKAIFEGAAKATP